MLGEALDGALPSSPPITAGVYVGQFRRETGGPPLLDEEFQVHQAAAEVPADYTKRCVQAAACVCACLTRLSRPWL